jgi:hypothetical protein
MNDSNRWRYGRDRVRVVAVARDSLDPRWELTHHLWSDCIIGGSHAKRHVWERILPDATLRSIGKAKAVSSRHHRGRPRLALVVSVITTCN